ncbi:MAG: TonB family protein [Deltaproteobacteria bacterium]|nr:TonB family protein [Candidatus Zymogenaceae bacterium]
MPRRRSISKLQRPGSGLSLTIVLSALIHLVLFGMLGYYVAVDKEETVVFSPPYSVSLVSGDEPGEGGQDGVEPPAVIDRTQPAAPAEDTAVTIPAEPVAEPVTVAKETPKKEEKPPVPTTADKKTETTEDLNSAIEKIRKKIEAEEAAKKKQADEKRLAEKPKEPVAPPQPKQPPPTPAGGTGNPAPGKPGGGNPYGYDNVFNAGGRGHGVPDPDLSAYYNEIWKRIRSLWAIPEGLNSSSLSTVYSIRISRDGRIVDVWKESGSGNGMFDDSAFRAIKKADPLPPIPDKYTDTTIDVGIRFHSDKR